MKMRAFELLAHFNYFLREPFSPTQLATIIYLSFFPGNSWKKIIERSCLLRGYHIFLWSWSILILEFYFGNKKWLNHWFLKLFHKLRFHFEITIWFNQFVCPIVIFKVFFEWSWELSLTLYWYDKLNRYDKNRRVSY